ncbi:MAG: lipopolysaccharide biosynthesis protein [Chitinophagales bacterium]|nr:lipopolysaccharide biosynthesis protein [Chitinophagales bacterium]
MGIVKRQSVPSAIAAYAGVALGFINFNYLLPRFATVEDVGLVKMLISAAVVFSQLGTLGIVYTTLRYFPYFNSRDKKHHGFLVILFTTGFAGLIIFSLAYFIFQEPIKSFYHAKAELFNEYILYVLPIGGLLLFSEILSGYSRSLYKTIVPTIIRELLVRICNSIAILLYIFKYIDFKFFVMLIVGGYAVQVLTMLLYLRWRKQLFLGTFSGFLTRPFAREMAGYTGFMFLTIISGIFITNIDLIMLGALSGLVSVGIYGVVVTISTIIIIPSRTITQIVVPIFSEAWKNNDIRKIKNMYSQTAINNLLIGAFIFILIWVNLDSFFSFLPKSYAQGKWVFFILGLSRLLDLGTGNNGEIILTSKHFRFILFTNLYLIAVTFLSYWWLIPRYDMLGAALATGISILSYNTIRSVFLYYKYGMHPITADYLKGLMMATAILIFASFLPPLHNIFWNIVYKSVFVSGVFLALIVWIKPSPDIDSSFNHIINIVRSKL